MSAVLGWDPGVSGAGTVLGRNGAVLYSRAVKSTMSERELAAMVGDAVEVLHAAGGGPAFVEKVQYIGKRKDGTKGDGGQGAFTFGGVYKFVLGCLHTRGIIVVNVAPMAWQAKLECMSGGNKNVTKRKAIELFPGHKITHSVADSMLIAEYGRRVTELRDDPLGLLS